MTPIAAAIVSGLFTGLSLIVAIGAQNAFVLRQGLVGKFVLPVALLSAVLDVALITLGVAGLGAVLESLPFLLGLVRWLGAGYLIWFGISSLRRANSGVSMDVSGQGKATLTSALISTATFSLSSRPSDPEPTSRASCIEFLVLVLSLKMGDRWTMSSVVEGELGLRSALRTVVSLLFRYGTWWALTDLEFPRSNAKHCFKQPRL
jgi:hypothetical protein